MSISILRTRDVPIKNGVVHKKREIINPAFSSFILAKRLYDKTVIKNDGRTLPINIDAGRKKVLQYLLRTAKIQKKSGGLSG